jgi:hypothetical protein
VTSALFLWRVLIIAAFANALDDTVAYVGEA